MCYKFRHVPFQFSGNFVFGITWRVGVGTSKVSRVPERCEVVASSEARAKASRGGHGSAACRSRASPSQALLVPTRTYSSTFCTHFTAPSASISATLQWSTRSSHLQCTKSISVTDEAEKLCMIINFKTQNFGFEPFIVIMLCDYIKRLVSIYFDGSLVLTSGTLFLRN